MRSCGDAGERGAVRGGLLGERAPRRVYTSYDILYVTIDQVPTSADLQVDGLDLSLAHNPLQTAQMDPALAGKDRGVIELAEVDITEQEEAPLCSIARTAFSFTFSTPSLSRSSTVSDLSECSSMSKRVRESPPHLDRLKKSKIAHRFVRSATLLGFKSSTTGRPSLSWIGTTVARSSSMAPAEEIWTCDQAVPAWLASEMETFRRYEQLCLSSPTEPVRRRAFTAPESISPFCDDEDDDPLPCRLSPESEDSLALVEELSIASADSQPVRLRSISAPALLELIKDEGELIEDPAHLKAQLLSVLRTRHIENGGTPAQPGEAALKLRKWVCWNGASPVRSLELTRQPGHDDAKSLRRRP